MAFYQHAVERLLRKLGIEMVGGMLTAHEKDERARQMAGDTLVSHCAFTLHTRTAATRF